MKDFHEDYYEGASGFYFNKILNTIINIGKLDKRDIKILDFGCSVGHLKERLGEKVTGYDILPKLTEVDDWRKVKFDVFVVNQVFCYFKPNELRNTIKEIRNINPKTELILARTRQNFLNKIAVMLSGVKDAHDGIILSPKEQVSIIKEKMNLIKKRNVFFMCDVYLFKFKD